MNSIAPKNAAATPVETREITQQLSNANLQLDLLNQSLEHLVNRLAPVLHSSAPEGKGEPVRPVQESPLGESLALLTGRIEASQARVGDLLQRLELD